MRPSGKKSSIFGSQEFLQKHAIQLVLFSNRLFEAQQQFRTGKSERGLLRSAVGIRRPGHHFDHPRVTLLKRAESVHPTGDKRSAVSQAQNQREKTRIGLESPTA
jgi:hypothetical protein